jgi:hypothetical protein
VIKSERVGNFHTTNNYGSFTIIDYYNKNNCTIQFEDGTILKNIRYQHIKNGGVKNPYHPSICGVGYIGTGKCVKDVKYYRHIYSIWTKMIQRCYDEKTQEEHPTYKNCTVIKEWHNFQVFGKWYNKTYEKDFSKNYQLDKDILVKGNKIYSPETCALVPREINIIFTTRENSQLPQGVSFNKSKQRFEANVGIHGRQIYLGTFNTIEEAFQVYKTAKESYIKEVAEIWKNKITEDTYNAMINHKILITD